jgi:hypothetical protein
LDLDESERENRGWQSLDDFFHLVP